MNIVKIDPAIYEFGEVPQEEYLEYFQYKNPVKVAVNTYQVEELGASLPAVEILKRDVPVPDKVQEGVEEEWNPSDLQEQKDAFRQNFEEQMAQMRQARQENERRLEQCYLFLRKQGLLEAFEKEYGEAAASRERRADQSVAEQAGISKQEEKNQEQKEMLEKQEEELQDLEKQKENIVLPGYAGTWQVVMKLLRGPDKEVLFVLKSETSADLEPVLVDRHAQTVPDTSLEYGLSAYTHVVENYRLAQQIVHLIEKQDPLFDYENGMRGWEDQTQAIDSVEEYLTFEAGRSWITEELTQIQSGHPGLAEEIGNIKEKLSALQSLRGQEEKKTEETREKESIPGKDMASRSGDPDKTAEPADWPDQEQKDITPEQKDIPGKQEEELQNLEEKKAHIVVPGLAGTWQVVMKTLTGPDKKERFVLKSETSTESALILVDQSARPVPDEDAQEAFTLYAGVESSRLAQQIVHLIEKTDPLFGYEEGFTGWENQTQAIGTMEENLTSESGREWIAGELAHIKLRHHGMEGEIGNINEKISALQSLREQRLPDQNRTEETMPAGKEGSRIEAEKTKQHKEQEEKTEMTKKKRLGM